jgi:CheY-like chemotaxis protein
MVGKQLMLVEDDEDDLLFFRDALQLVDPGVELLHCSDGLEALEFFRAATSRPDWVFLDMNMPRMNGIQLLRELDPELIREVPFIIYTTSSLPRDWDQTRQLGARQFVVKPTRLQDLCDALRGVIGGDTSLP